MIRTLTVQTLSLRLRSNLTWAAALLFWSVIMVAIFPSVGQTDFSQLIENYPQEVLTAFGIEDINAMSTPIGYLNAELFSMIIPLSIVFLPLGVISAALPAAEERHHLDNLLSAPLARWQVVCATALAAAASLFSVLLLLWLGTLLAAELIGVDLGWWDLARSCAAVFALASLVAAVGLLVAGARGGRGATTGIAAGLLVVLYMLPVVASFVGSLEVLKDVSVFSWYTDWINNGIDWLRYLLLLVLAMIFTGLSAGLFERRDIAS